VTKREKQLEQFLRNPAATPYRVIEKLLIQAGFQKAQAAGSHIKFRHPASQWNLIIAIHGSDCKPYLKKQAAEAIKSVI
jgi:predicted RNA binding protein YcfA (HicA-like mRNA interferase family)